MAVKIMIQGTMSSAGKSLIAAGLCRIFHQDGYRVAPFKSQNMALNSFVTADGLEMGRAQVMQAEAAGTEPSVDMNPILLKPTSDKGSQVIVRGEVLGNMDARAYFKYKPQLKPVIREAFARLEEDYDIIVIEGAGSPAEINLKENDIVNMGIAEMFDSNVLLVGDIDRGGVFAQLAGTLMLLPEDERARVKGLVINKFRGDKTLLDPGIDMIYEMCHVPVCGTVPYIKDLRVDDEDSLSERLNIKRTDTGHSRKNAEGNSSFGTSDIVDIAVIRLPHISNFTDFDVFDSVSGCRVRYVSDGDELSGADMVILPGSKNTISDMMWLREKGLDKKIIRAADDIPVFGICGGFQILGHTIEDRFGSDSGALNDDDGRTRTAVGIDDNNPETVEGLGLLPVCTHMKKNKTRRQVAGVIPSIGGIFKTLSGKKYSGYEIHMGDTVYVNGDSVIQTQDDPTMHANGESMIHIQDDQVIINSGNVYGTYIHGIFDDSDIAAELVSVLAERKGLDTGMTGTKPQSYSDYKEKQYDRLAEVLRESLDMKYIYSILN